jgi:hypothetical protein
MLKHFPKRSDFKVHAMVMVILHMGLGYEWLLPLSAIFQLYRGNLFLSEETKKNNPDITTILPQVTDNFYHKVISSTPYYE